MQPQLERVHHELAFEPIDDLGGRGEILELHQPVIGFAEQDKAGDRIRLEPVGRRQQEIDKRLHVRPA